MDWNALGPLNGIALGETSGAGYTDASGNLVAVLTGATAYTTDSGPGPLPAYQSSYAAGIPLGFSPDGTFYTSSAGVALPTTSAASVVFRAYASNGIHNNNSTDIIPASIILTSTEAPSLSVPFTFSLLSGGGPLGQTQYTTAPFALPAALTTTGLHDVQVSIADVAGYKSHTNFDFVELAPGDSGVLFSLGTATVPAGEPAKSTAGINTVAATITNAITGARTRVVLDDSDAFILFAAPGSQTITVTANVTVTHPDGTTETLTQTGTQTDTLAPGEMFIGGAVNVAGTTPAAPVASARPRVKKAIVIKH